MKYDFVEIGTSNFDTLIEQADDTTVGLSIEPIKKYLDDLPDKPQVKKVHCAVSFNNQTEILQIFYVPDHVIVENNLPNWLKGCNSIGNYHYQHHKLGITQLVKKHYVPCYPIGNLFEKYDITELDYLKIDTEGSDCDIMLSLHDFLIDHDQTMYPAKILFESNELSSKDKIEIVKSKFVDLGYSVTEEGSDTILSWAGKFIT